MKAATLALVILAAPFVGLSAMYNFGTRDIVTDVVVTDKERITTGSGDAMSSKYLVFTEHEVFENTDAFLALKFNSSDIQGQIGVGETCTLRVYGWRVPFLSMYRNILEADCQ